MSTQQAPAAGVLVAPDMRDLSRLAEDLVLWLARRMPEVRQIEVKNLEYPRGAGQSHETILFDASWREGGVRRDQGLVVRIKPTRFTVFLDDMFREQYELMRIMHETGVVRVAKTFWFEEDPSILGAPFFVMEKLAGRVAVSIPSYMEQGWVFEATPAQRARLWENSVREFAAIQKAPLSQLEFLARWEAGDGFEQEWDRWRRYLRHISDGRPMPFLSATWRRLEETQPANRPPGLVWGDARLGNMMVGGNFEILAVMDWEQPSLGGALHDLGWWLFIERRKIDARGGTRLEGFGSREETVELWSGLTGISTADLDWYEAFAAFKMACLASNMADMRKSARQSEDVVCSGSMREAITRLLP